MDFDANIRAALEELPDALVAEVGLERALELTEKQPELLTEAIKKATEASGRALAERLKDDGPAMLARRRAERRAFEERLARRWAPPFDLAQMAMVVSYEAGEAFNEKHWQAAEAENDVVFVVLVRLHARACRIAEEVLVLLKAGFGQAALARWRALHEVAVVAFFIKEHDRDTAERYLLHENVEAWKGMEELQARVDRLGHEPFTEDELDTAKAAYEELVDRYGKKYASPYGWAQAALAAENPKYEKDTVTFRSIEEAVSLDHLRPYYRMASHGTHANPKGILFTPDALKSAPEVLLAGPGSTGLADPGQCALLSLTKVTTTLLTYKTGESAPLILTALLQLTDEAANAYVETQRAVERGDEVLSYGLFTRTRYRAAPRIAVERVRLRRAGYTAMRWAREQLRRRGTSDSPSAGPAETQSQ